MSGGRKQQEVRRFLRQSGKGHTVKEIAEKLFSGDRGGARQARGVLYSMPDVYISGWERNWQGVWVAQWSAVIPPPAAPRPAK